ncbi:MAG: M67 family metallopeptidase [Dehalococcoidia bacterium]|nr:M67 family metallopeptidase [Dehalococcoidia bacterium]
MIYLEQTHLDEMLSHAREKDPVECCGLLAGKSRRVSKVYRVTNSAASATRYLMEPRELIEIFREIDTNGWDILAIYHSHTHTESYPSQTDLDLAYWSDPLYIIISLEDKPHPKVRAFHIEKGMIEEREIKIIQAPLL